MQAKINSEKKVTCDYCLRPAILVTGQVMYPHRPDLVKKKFWKCIPCKAYVGCHPVSKHYSTDTVPLGRLANAKLRKLKSEAHAAFDPLWKTRMFTRKEAYSILAIKLGIKVKDCHIGMFDDETCLKVVQICEDIMQERKY